MKILLKKLRLALIEKVKLSKTPNIYNKKFWSNFGLCLLVIDIFGYYSNDRFEVVNFIRLNRPKYGEKFYDEEHSQSGYFWEESDYQTRLDWLDYLIENL
jgi:hypothetical protein